jgi:calcium homeostasis ER protein
LVVIVFCPKDIKLPPPCPTTERLINAVEAFYAPPSHESPRDTEGWEKLGLYEYYKDKKEAVRRKREDIEAGERERSRTPSPIKLDRSPLRKKLNEAVKRKKSILTKKEKARSKSRSRSRSRSRTPPKRFVLTYTIQMNMVVFRCPRLA